ncbi:SIR2 family NAD-dependent protein deacylase [Rhodoligotrophos defluvii]|uniref:SIR2 family NAD-dependent protein deacylase n=1 Tax=Rhodoligotrophos defluvii TaxID=2561934 RepID=UPI001EEF8EE3|nr:SIR2 family protein [Rhodoligotrophos defluvii]
MDTVHNPDRFMADLRQILSQGRKRIGVLIGAGGPLSVRVDATGKLDPNGQALIPGVNVLTDQALLKLTGTEGAAAAAIRASLPDGGNIETILSKIRLLQTALGDTPMHGLDGPGYAALGKAICDAIGEIVGAKLPEGRTPYHELVSWVSGTQRAHPVEIFTTNYDLLIESAFEQAKAPYFDGFSGGHAPFFDPVTVAGNDLPPRWSRVWKLHGSLGWKSDSGTVVRCGGTDCTELVYPDHLKYDLTQKQPYAALFERLKRFLLTPDTVLLATGFSFRDAHICAVLGEALAMNANAAVIALQFQTLAEEEPARKLAFEHPNLSVYASDAAVIGGIPGQWRLGDLPKNWGEIRSSFWGKRGGGDAFLLGDFASFCRFCALSYSPDLARPTDAGVPIDATEPAAVSA